MAGLKIRKAKNNNVVTTVYPIGSIYLSVSETSPSSFIGGSWTQIKDTFLLSAGDVYAAGSTGGEAEHTLDINEMPSHNHGVLLTSSRVASGTEYARITAGGTVNTGVSRELGGSQPHNNMPPYLAVYVWQRIA